MSRNAWRVYGMIAVVLGMIVAFALWKYMQWHGVIIYITTVNVVTLAYYLWDKLIAPTSFLRVPETLLHFLALLGGSPAALCGQKIFHHKTQKTSFQLWFWMIALVQICLLGYWLYVQ